MTALQKAIIVAHMLTVAILWFPALVRNQNLLPVTATAVIGLLILILVLASRPPQSKDDVPLAPTLPAKGTPTLPARVVQAGKVPPGVNVIITQARGNASAP